MTGPVNGAGRSAVDAEQRLADEGIGGDIYLFKNTDSAGNSYGCHENHLIVRAGESSPDLRRAAALPGHPPAICGPPGTVTPKAATYCLSQRVELTFGRASLAPRPDPAPLSLRDGHMPTPRSTGGCSRPIVTSETTTMPKVGTAALVLEMIESGVADFSLDNPIRAIREVSYDVTGRRPVRLAGGSQGQRAGHPAGATPADSGAQRADRAGRRPVGPPTRCRRKLIRPRSTPKSTG